MADSTTFVLDDLSAEVHMAQSLVIVGLSDTPGPSITLSFKQVFDLASLIASELAEGEHDGE